MDARIWVSSGGEAPRSVALSRERTVVGRSPEAEVQLEDEAVSWNHLEIERRGEVLMATDLDSRNGTALNGEPLDRPRPPARSRGRAGDAGRGDGAEQRPLGGADRGGAGDRGGTDRALPQRGRL